MSRLDAKRFQAVLCCQWVEFQVRNVLIILHVASHQRKIVLKCDSGIDQIERAGFDALLFFFKCSRRTTHRFATESEKRRICSFASEAVVETPLLLLSVSPARKREHHHKACYDKSKNNGKTIELGKGDNTRQFQA